MCGCIIGKGAVALHERVYSYLWVKQTEGGACFVMDDIFFQISTWSQWPRLLSLAENSVWISTDYFRSLCYELVCGLLSSPTAKVDLVSDPYPPPTPHFYSSVSGCMVQLSLYDVRVRGCI